MTTLPARLREAHCHIEAHGRSLSMLDASACPTREAFLLLLASARPGPDGLILGHGARPEAWPDGGWPSADEVDQATGGTPAAVWCFDFHAILLGRSLLERMGFGADTPDPAGGRFERDRAGTPTGLLLESAATIAWNRLTPARTDRTSTVAGLRDLARFFREAHDLKAKPDLAAELPSLLDEAGVDLHVELFPLVGDLDAALAARPSDPRVHVAGGKIFVDGTLNSRTAWMLQPYADGPEEQPAGMALMSPAEIENAIAKCSSLGLRLACHAIGDGAVRAVLDAAERVRPPRWTVRLEHAEVIDAADAPRFTELGVVASVQPCHLLTDIEALGRALPDRLERVLPLRELIDSGLEPGRTLVFGSDAPIVRPDPEDSIRGAVHRSRPDSVSLAPEQAIAEAEAWACFDTDIPVASLGEG